VGKPWIHMGHGEIWEFIRDNNVLMLKDMLKRAEVARGSYKL